MVLVGQGMEPEAPTKVQVVYYLSRAGQLQQPHLIDVPVSAHSNGLYLRDVKKKLTSVRGEGVADSFSWSCKRNYKDNFIWQDLADDDKILPLSDGEFVLKGSGLYPSYRGESDDDVQYEPESTSTSLKNRAKFNNIIESKKLDFEGFKRNVDLQADNVQDQSDLAAALNLSLQLMSNPHSTKKGFSKDKSMDLNQQVMNSLSQAKSGPVECMLDHSYDMSSCETFQSEESTVQNSAQEMTRERAMVKSTSSSSRTEADYDPAKQTEIKDRTISRDGSKVGTSFVKCRQEKPDELLLSIKTKRFHASSEYGETTPFMLSPRRIMAALSTPEKVGKMPHSSSPRSSTLSTTTSLQNEPEPLQSTIKLSKQATCLSQLRLCSQLNHHATDSRPDSPVRQNHLSVGVPPSALPQSPTLRGHGAPYWARWKSGRKLRSSEGKAVVEPVPPTKSNSHDWPDDRDDGVRRGLRTSFEFERPLDVSPPTVAMASQQTENSSSSSGSSQSVSLLAKTVQSCSSVTSSRDTSDGGMLSPTALSNGEVVNAVSVNEVITQHLPIQSSSSDGGRTGIFSIDSSGKDIVTAQLPIPVADGGQKIRNDTGGVPKISISDSISAAARETVRSTRSESPESPLQSNPPSSPVRSISPVRASSPARALSSPSSFSKRTEDGRARARGMVKEVGSKDSRFMKDLAKELDRAKGCSFAMRSVTASKRIPMIKTASAASVGLKSIPSRNVNRSPPRISSMLWEDSPITPKKIDSAVDRDERPLTAGRSNLDWEKTLQEAGNLSLPPPDFGQILQECGQCGRTFKPDSLKVHVRGCHALRRREFHTFNGVTLSMRARQ